ncbi:MAG: response regulator [Bradyrhizobium sp.]|jgi:DNA-binding NtrC family response regulator|uniref:Response regulator n=1 Tax=Bradyrhizobium denitrificans TaxID=2734912 RepID=A0ABS5G1G1_9BRAD|nr:MULTISPECIES: response regulator [Bradyrhizobium]MBR1135026.1 response regulator [Bradyrhizobium denitrificans]MDU0958452.1 response regulator [Bradyrhizobium sp.]MDU1492475.1 response regulator [Bradyrhizobium sp.]MDU1542032.1 response regulator [Bradyrhizobium sp.]MDU1669209.1 response regulator [Bradyrhizobium sp.]
MRNELLVIEDADVHLSILRKIATQAGFNTTGVSSVDAASAILRTRYFDCVTLDLSLGERSGTEVLQRLAELKYRGPVLIISASENDRLDASVRIGNFLELNVCPPFSKPINLPLLRQTLKQIASETDRQKLVRRQAGRG